MDCMNNVSVSIIIPVYNAEEKIDRCMRSVFSQTFDNYEIILVNDGSMDSSAEICCKYAANDTRITFIDKENGGAGSARNAGLDVAKGKYIYFCDIDDEMDSNLLFKAYFAAYNNDADLVVFSINRKTIESDTGEIISEKTIPQRSEAFNEKEDFRKNFSRLYYEGVFFGGPVNKLFKNAIIKRNNVRFPDLKRGQDEIFNLLYYPYVEKCVIIPDVLYTYFSYDEKSKNKKYKLNYFETTTKTYLRTFEELIKAFDLTDEYTLSKFQNSFVYSMENSVLLAFNPVEGLSKKQKIQFIGKVMHDGYVLPKIGEISHIPESHIKFWQLFSAGDPYTVYKFLRRRLTVTKIKTHIRKAIRLRGATPL